ncbi:MAG: hypothetical protein KatS3mg002_1373 [Candidatus Woesearchaeota archaeon]|nr:MAG: hypothetical protein KatS3mg002_1373 [Candidatus Woesearchaeota archaeon]
MKVILQPNPYKKPVIKYDRITDIRKGKDGLLEESTIEEQELTRAPGTIEVLCANPSMSKGGLLNTGLDRMVENEFAEEKHYRDEQFRAVLEGKKEAKLQHILEYKHGKPFNYYTNQIDYQKKYTSENLHTIPFFQTAESFFKVKDGANFLDTSIPREEIIYYYLTAPGRTDVCTSFSELNGNHRWLLTTQEEIEEVKSSKKKEKNAIIAKFQEIEDKKDDTLLKFAKILNLARRNMSRDQAYTALDNYLNQPGKKGELARAEFNSVYKLWNDKTTREKFNVRALIWDLDSYRVVYRTSGNSNYVWQPPKDENGITPKPMEWTRYNDLVKFMLDPKNEPEVSLMINQLEIKKGFLD